MKSTKYIFILAILIYSCSTDKNSEKVSSNFHPKIEVTTFENQKVPTNHFVQDSLTVWVNADFENSIHKDISICNCWKEIKYHILHYDTIKLELYLKSNLKHYGHDSELIFPLKRTGNTFRYDSTLNSWPVQAKEFVIPTNETLTLLDGNQSYVFNKRVFKYARDTTKKHFFVYSQLSDIFYNLNSHLLLKYNEVDSIKSTHDLIALEKLKQLINSNKVTAHCSDDYGLDGITINDSTNRYFELVFGQGEVSLYENKGRARYEKLELDSLPKQVLRIK